MILRYLLACAKRVGAQYVRSVYERALSIDRHSIYKMAYYVHDAEVGSILTNYGDHTEWFLCCCCRADVAKFNCEHRLPCAIVGVRDFTVQWRCNAGVCGTRRLTFHARDAPRFSLLCFIRGIPIDGYIF